MKQHGWFLPKAPDLLGMLAAQLAVTVEGMDKFSAWAAGDADAADAVRACEHRADTLKRELQISLRSAFVTPIDPEDLFTLSRGVDGVLNRAKDAVGESEVMDCPPDALIAEMASLLTQATRELATAIARLAPGDKGDPTQAAEAAIKAERGVEHVYRRAMGALVDVDDLREVTARRELYRRCSRIGESVAEVAERVAYAVIKES